MKTSAELLAESFQRARHHWRRQSTEGFKLPPAPNPAPAFTVAISRQIGAGGTEIANEVGKRTSWPVYDRDLVEGIAKESGLRTELLESVDEKTTSWLVESLHALSGKEHVSSGTYARRLAEVLLALSAHGNCVIVGRGAANVLPVEKTLRIRIIAAEKDRVASIEKEIGVSQREATRHMEKMDQQRDVFVREHFHKDVSRPEQYDLVINSSRFTVEQSAELILEALHRRRGYA